jgi:hypothetical protein
MLTYADVGCAAVSCVRVLAGGLREQFVPYMKSCVSSILILLKDKDKRMLEEVHKALRAIVGVSMTLEELCMQRRMHTTADVCERMRTFAYYC